MKLVIDIDRYLLEHCKRHVKEGYANRIEEAIVDGVPLEDMLDKIRAEIDGTKMMPKNRTFFRDGIDCALQIIDKYKKKWGKE